MRQLVLLLKTISSGLLQEPYVVGVQGGISDSESPLRAETGANPSVARICIGLLLIVSLYTGVALGADIAPAKKDKCPVCGMLVYMYKDWAAKVEFNDGTTTYFDGPKDMFRYWFDIRKYASGGKSQADVRTILVTEYYDLEPMDARSAFYVLGSNVMGPMGHELIPFKSEAQAKEFMKDHKGKRILGFGEITAEIMKGIN